MTTLKQTCSSPSPCPMPEALRCACSYPRRAKPPEMFWRRSSRGGPSIPPGLGTVTLPRFETESTLPLDGILQSAGLASMYQGGFTELATAEGVPADLLITEVLQKARISVGEEGTEAAAVTIVAASEGAFLPQGEPFRFLADRPFVYTIDYGNTSLFLGVQSSF